MRRTQKAGRGSGCSERRSNDPLNHVEPGCCCGTSDAGWRQLFISPDSKTGLSAPPDPKMIRSRARTGTADAPCFQRVISLFSLCYLLSETSSKSLIPLSDCPFVLNHLPVFLENLPVSRKKNRGLCSKLRNQPACRWYGDPCDAVRATPSSPVPRRALPFPDWHRTHM